jgi:hypothetical protein
MEVMEAEFEPEGEINEKGNELFPPLDWEAPNPPLVFHPKHASDDDGVIPVSLDWDEWT